MNKKELFLRQLARTSFITYEEILNRYELCDRNLFRLISLQESLFTFHNFKKIENKKQVEEFLKRNVIEVYYYFRILPGPSDRSILLKKKNKTECIYIPIVKEENEIKEWIYSYEIFNIRKAEWETETRVFKFEVNPKVHILLKDVPGKRRNAKLITNNRIDLLYANPYALDQPLILKSNYDFNQSKAGAPIFIENGKILSLSDL